MMAAIGTFFFQYRNAVFPFAFLLVLLPGPRLFPDALVAAAVGAAIAFLGQLVRGLTIGLRYVIRGGKNRRVYAEDLVTDGLYGHTRNPMYVGNLLILAGVAVASNSWGCVGIAIPLFTFVYIAIVAAEERYLRDKFGDGFAAYTREVPRWLLRLQGLRATLAESQFRWRRVLVKEYGTPTGWILGICVIALWNLWQTEQLEARANAVEGLIIVMIATALFWLVARALKKSRTLVAD
jgi:protein-S-isoprenylcysteine O-methyltransferase Ste14